MHRALTELLQYTGGIIGRRQNRNLATRIDAAARAGELVSLLPGVYTVPELRHDWRVRADAVPWWNDNAVISGDAAAALTFWPELRPTTVEVCGCETIAPRPGYTLRRRRVPPEFVIGVAGRRVVGPALTALDLIATHGGDAIDRVLRSRMTTLAALHRALELTPHRRGNVDRRGVLLDSRGEPWSAAERLAHRKLRTSGITRWHANVPFVADGKTFFLDIDLDDYPLAIEIDGKIHLRHDVFESDRHRGNALLLAGKSVLHFTWRMVNDEPGPFIPTVLRALQQARTVH